MSGRTALWLPEYTENAMSTLVSTSNVSFQRRATALISVAAFTTLSALITIATFIALVAVAQPTP
jgi:hypothetical protein